MPSSLRTLTFVNSASGGDALLFSGLSRADTGVMTVHGPGKTSRKRMDPLSWLLCTQDLKGLNRGRLGE